MFFRVVFVLALVSGPPEEFNVNVLENGRVNVTWRPPSVNNEAIVIYVVYYKKTGEQNYTEVKIYLKSFFLKCVIIRKKIVLGAHRKDFRGNQRSGTG